MATHVDSVTGGGIGATLITVLAIVFEFFDTHYRGIAALTGVCMLLLTWWNMRRMQEIAESKTGRRKDDE
jgi:hypothetical protein